MIKKTGFAVAVLVLILLGFAATRPDTFRVERSVEIQAAPGKVFPLINDFHNWPAWSPWEKLDPAMKETHGGAAAGVGASYAWEGNGKVGAGRMEITDSSAPAKGASPNAARTAKVVIKLDFLKPFEGHDTAEFLLAPEGAKTKVTWAMYGPNNFLSKLFGVFCSMDKMIGKDFESGLAGMKTAAEKSS